MVINTTKPRLIILSDLWGRKKSFWIEYYRSLLENEFTIKYYDCCELANLDTTEYTAEHLHWQFLNGGIEKAVENLRQLEKGEIDVLAFSIGGVVAWKACLKGLKAKSIFALSSTRLRNEVEKPEGVIKLFYGENDESQPNNQWFQDIKIERQIVKDEGHEFYQKLEFAKRISKLLVIEKLKF
ncbi:alpha/beta hydrolase [Chryseobacterium sp. SNU WT5]|uniref:alpha/beta hydrolase n=1 Tax=Chryseobacterium sp. SNU WT5 TaxID=2594269 RepID=UPI0011817579|nr:alpha/beta hydrolase [Chryseobacterium sp. SNU WT5]QDP84273.1 alpha/beta hydrolase [Chryseobacterium sp. SNU WT5]